VSEAIHGEDALNRLNQQSPAVIVTDLEMPIMNGIELVRRIRTIDSIKNTPVIIFTTRSSEQDKRLAFDAGADAFLVKSDFQEEVFINTITRVLSQRRGASA
jgi:two-component system chemotaxis sensor kinase CheA